MAKRNDVNSQEAKRMRSRIKRTTIFSLVGAACLSVGALTAAAAAGYGPMASLYRHYFKDETTARLVEDGYYYTLDADSSDTSTAAADSEYTHKEYPGIGETAVDDIFEAKLIGVAGDAWNPKVLVDLTVHDEEIVKDNEYIAAFCLALDVPTFEGTHESYYPYPAECVQDDQTPEVYHLSFDAAPLWLTSGETTVFSIEAIYYNGVDENHPSLMEQSNQSWPIIYDEVLSQYGAPLKNEETTDYYDYATVRDFIDSGKTPDDHEFSEQELEAIPEELLKSKVERWWDIYNNFDDEARKKADIADEHIRILNEYISQTTESLTNLQFRFLVPKGTFKPVEVQQYDYDDIIFDHNGTKYSLAFATYDSYTTTLAFSFDFIGSPLAGDSQNYFEVEAIFNADLKEFFDSMVVMADGEEYHIDPETEIHSWCDVSGKFSGNNPNKCHIKVEIPPIDFDNAESVVIEAGAARYELK